MEPHSIEIVKLAENGNKLISDVKETLQNSDNEVLKALTKRVPVSVVSNDEAIQVVFAGHYSAGKSTILKQLTGRQDIVCGSPINTETAQIYDWNGVKVVDTPGIHTQIRPDHDEISYQAISEADLLVYVITSQLFDDEMGRHFRKLAIDRDKAHEMMLVVNKMQKSELGNTPKNQAIIREDLRKVLFPYSPEELHLSFLDAELAIDSSIENDQRLSTILWKKSGFDIFIKSLNQFIRDKGLTGRFSTSLYILEQVLQEALASDTTKDQDVNALEALLLQRRRAIIETRERIPRSVAHEIQQISAQIRKEGRNIADQINGTADQKEVNRNLQEAQDRVQKYSEDLGHKVQETINIHITKLDERLGEILDSELARELIPRLVHRIDDANISPEMMVNMKKISSISTRLGSFLVKNAYKGEAGTLAALSKLSEYSGTCVHQAVLDIGHFFGKSFKPWEAVRWTRGIANAGRALAIVGCVLLFVLQIKEDCDAAQLESDLRESRSAVRNGFNEAAHIIEMHYEKATDTYVASIFDQQIEEIDASLKELQNMQANKSILYSKLLSYLAATRALILQIHSFSTQENVI